MLIAKAKMYVLLVLGKIDNHPIVHVIKDIMIIIMFVNYVNLNVNLVMDKKTHV